MAKSRLSLSNGFMMATNIEYSSILTIGGVKFSLYIYFCSGIKKTFQLTKQLFSQREHF